MIPVRVEDVSYDEAPPEFVRSNILPANPNWHDCLAPLFETLEAFTVPKTGAAANADTLRTIGSRWEDGESVGVSLSLRQILSPKNTASASGGARRPGQPQRPPRNGMQGVVSPLPARQGSRQDFSRRS